MGDITIVWDAVNNRGDWAITSGDLQTGNDLETAVLVSLFTYRVLPGDIAPPDDTADRRGWWADTYESSPIGSRLWTLSRAKKANATAVLQQAQDMCLEALQWLIDDGVAASVEATAFWASPVQLGIIINITEPDGTTSTFNYSWAWSGV